MTAQVRQRLAALVLALGLIGLGHAATSAEAWRERLPQASLIGSGEFRWFGFAVYRASLWSPAAQVDFQQPFALQLHYRRSISRDTLVQSSLEEIRRLRGQALAPQQQADWAQQMSRAFVDVSKGSRITGVFLPEQGCRFYVDGKLQHVIDDPAFARAFFSIWLDPQTRSPELRAALLGLNP